MEHQIDCSETTSHLNYLIPRNSHYKTAEIHYQKNNQNLQSYDEKMLQAAESRSSIEPSEYEGDEDEKEETTFKLEEMRYSDARLGICSVCHYSMTGNNANPVDFERALLCSDGHLLCHQCVQRFAIQSDTNCVLCAASESQHSISSVSQNSSIKNIKTKRKNRTPALRSRREKRTSTASTHTSRTNVPAHCSAGINYTDDCYEDNWDETEHEEVDDEYEVEKKISYLTKEIQQPSYYSLQKESDKSTKAQINSQMMSECSRRPIQCPRLDCAVNVAFSALTNHFIFDHPEVPILSVDPGEKSTLIVNFDGLVYDSSRCLALLLVSDKLSGPAARQFNGSHIHPRYKNRLPLPILAARLHCNASSQDGNVSATGDDHDDGRDVVIAWVAGLDIGNTTTGALRCSIQAIDSIDGEAFRSLTYTGPINSLRTAQKPREVFLTGDCVILHDGFINHIISGCENLNVNVTIH